MLSLFIRNKPIHSSERMLHKDCDHKGSVQKKNLVVILKELGAKMNRLAVNCQL
jgi:Ca2+-binding EF-hand superfamily protein